MFDSWELATGLVGLAVTGLGALSTLLWLWRFYGQRIKDKDDEIQRLRAELDPRIAFERDELQRQVTQLQSKIGEHSSELSKERQAANELHAQISSLRHQLESAVGKANKYAVHVKNNAAWYRKEKQRAEQKGKGVADLEMRIAKVQQEAQTRLRELRQERDDFWESELFEQKNQLDNEIRYFEESNNKIKKELNEKTAEIEKQGIVNKDLDAQLEDYKARHAKILNREGRIWERPVSETAPPFVPLAQRKAPIISVLNLKGGVGKTTITANLAALLGMRANENKGKRPLVIDLDYQRSLTQLCCTPDELKKLHERKLCVQHFFLSPLQSQNGESVRPLSRVLLDSVAEVRRKKMELFSILACSEDNANDDLSSSLDDTEMHLFAEWLLEESGPDIRLNLREALHAESVQDEFSYILLDCPPRLSLACINALAASDFVLIPVILDQTSAVSVPLLLQKIDRLRNQTTLISSLKPLGIVANKVDIRGDGLLKAQKRVHDQLSVFCEEVLSEPVPIFEAMIRKRDEIGAVSGGEEPEFACCKIKAIRDWFDELMTSIEKRIQDERKNAQPILAQSDNSIARKQGIR